MKPKFNAAVCTAEILNTTIDIDDNNSVIIAVEHTDAEPLPPPPGDQD